MGFIGRINPLAANLVSRHDIWIFIYPEMSHGKSAVYDGWVYPGPASYDRLSLRLNSEISIAATAPSNVAQRVVAQVLVPDFACSLELRESLSVAGWTV